MVNYLYVILPNAKCVVHFRLIAPVLPRLSQDSSMLCTLV